MTTKAEIIGERAVAWHFHHDPSKSAPLAIVRSLAARRLARLAGVRLEKAEIETFAFSQRNELAGWVMIPGLALLLGELGLRRTVLRTLP